MKMKKKKMICVIIMLCAPAATSGVMKHEFAINFRAS